MLLVYRKFVQPGKKFTVLVQKIYSMKVDICISLTYVKLVVIRVPAHPGCPGQFPQSRKTVVCVCVCVCVCYKGKNCCLTEVKYFIPVYQLIQ